MWNKVSYDPRSYERNLCNCVYRSLENQDFNGVWTRDLVIPVRRSNHLSYEAIDVASWNISYITSHPFFTGSLELTNDQLPTSAASRLSWLEHRTGIVRSRVPTPLKSWLLQANCLSCAHNCDDHSLLDFKSAVQYMEHFIYHFTFHILLYITKWVTRDIPCSLYEYQIFPL